MSNEVIAFSEGGLPATTDELIKGLQNVGSTLQSSGGVPFLRLLKDGCYVYGAEDIEPEEDSLWAMNPNSLQHGWACWDEGELLGEVMVPFTQAPPPRGELQNFGPEWRQQVSMVLQCVNGEDEGLSVLYKGTSKGLHNAVKKLVQELVHKLQTDPKHCVPVLALERDSYKHKKYGETFYPVLTVRKWVAFDGSAAAEPAPAVTQQEPPSQEPAAPEPAPESTGRSRRGRGRAEATAAAADESSGEDAPTRSRRRRRG